MIVNFSGVKSLKTEENREVDHEWWIIDLDRNLKLMGKIN